MACVFVKLFHNDFGRTSTMCVNSDSNQFTVRNVKEDVSFRTGIPVDSIHLYSGNCCLRNDEDSVQNGQFLHVQPKLLGGKGGFGSMLRAIGAQIEKTTNKEACRDLSGRRLRDINEEKRLKKWIAKQAEREREKAERKRLRLERMRAAPHHVFHDSTYDQQRSNLAETITDSLSQGLQKKRKAEPDSSKSKVAKPTVKPHMKEWFGVDNDGSSSSASDSEDSTSSHENSSASSSTQSTEIQPSCSTIQPTDVSVDKSAGSDDQSVPSSSKCQAESISSEQQVQSANSAPATTTSNNLPSTVLEETGSLDLVNFNSVEELEEVGLDRLKYALMALSMKCGGTLRQRAERLFSVKGLKKEQIDISLLAKPFKTK